MGEKEEPNPSWSAEKMTRYLEEKYGKEPRFSDGRTGRPISIPELVRLFDGKPRK